MYSEITGATPLAALTVDQFVDLLNKGKTSEPTPAPQPSVNAAEVVRGIRGIRELFGVCHTTACRYRATFLRPAVSQRGRVIVTNVAEAIRLFNENR